VTPRIVFIATDPSDINMSINTELRLANYLMTSFPGHIFVSRATFIMTELFAPRPDREWADFYRALIECCDVIYCHEGFERHPLVDYGFDLGLSVVHDEMDLALWLATAANERDDG
jgi:hypothetical protein